MSGFAYSLIGFLIAIAILVAVHEFGHFWVARMSGVKVLRFSVGLGRPIFSWRRRNDPTEYSIGLIPLGGYVKMLDEREGEVADEEKQQAFNRKPLAVRAAVVAAGPAFNFLFAILAMWIVFVVGSDDVAPQVGEVQEGSVAEQAGFLPGDTLMDIDGRSVTTWSQHQFYLLHRAMQGRQVAIGVDHATQGARRLWIDFSQIDQSQISGRPITSQIGLWPPAPAAVVTEIMPDSPAQRAGLQRLDRVIALDDEAVSDWIDMATRISGRPGDLVQLTIDRAGQELSLPLTVGAVEVEGKTFGQIGLYRPPLDNYPLRLGPVEAVWQAIDYNWHMTVITLKSIGRMLTAQMSAENLSGPITIARIAGHTAASGFADFMKFLAIISISLGLLNLLPIPVLDGGHLLYYLYEAVFGKEPSERAAIWGQQIGLGLIVMLMVLAFYNDIARLVQS